MLDLEPSLVIGVPEIDAQHKVLFEEVASFEAAVNAHLPYRFREFLTYLQMYARTHFEAEERLMRDVGYPLLAAHIHEHSDFKRRLQSLVPKWEVESDSPAFVLAVHGLLHFWLADHVTVSDKRLQAFLRTADSTPLSDKPSTTRRRGR